MFTLLGKQTQFLLVVNRVSHVTPCPQSSEDMDVYPVVEDKNNGHTIIPSSICFPVREKFAGENQANFPLTQRQKIVYICRQCR